MNLSVTPVRRPSTAPAAASRRSPLASIDPHAAEAVRIAARVDGVADRRTAGPVTFNSALS